jgi:ATP-dependent Clp protease ATP-binding subunit ClpC
LTPQALATITRMALEETRARLAAQGVGLAVSDAAVAWLAGRARAPELGARPLRRTIGREVERRLSRMLLAGEVVAGQEVRLERDDPAVDALVFRVTRRDGGDGLA